MDTNPRPFAQSYGVNLRLSQVRHLERQAGKLNLGADAFFALLIDTFLRKPPAPEAPLGT
jgi:hypothetical protein